MTEGQLNTPVPKNTTPPSSSASDPTKGLVIRTMRDDLAQARSGGTTVSQGFNAPVHPPAPPLGRSVNEKKQYAPPSPKNLTPSPLRPNLPLPAKGVKLEPEPKRIPKKKKSGLRLVLLVLLLLAIVGGGGAWGWLSFGDQILGKFGIGGRQPVSQGTGAIMSVDSVIPSNSLLVAHYTVTDDTQRATIKQAWDAKGAQDVTMLATLTGDPRLLLEQQISEFMYVLLPGDPRFYLVLPAGDSTDQFLAKYSNIQVAKIGQWRVIHSFNTSLYKDMLGQGSLTDSNGQLPSASTGLALMMNGQLISQLHKYGNVIAPTTGYMKLSAQLVPSEAGATVVFASLPGPLTPPPVSIDTTELLQRVPDDAEVVRIGSSFANQAFRSTAPAAAQLFNELTGPYVYYERTGNDGVNDAGLIIQIPEDKKGTYQLPDNTIEQALPAIVMAAGLGEGPASALAFIDTVYQDVALRYVNLSTPQLALDYMIDNNFITVATSREGMYTAINVLQQKASNSLSNASWSALQAATSTIGNDRIFALTRQPAIKRLFPGGEEATSLPIAVAFDPASPSQAVAGSILLP